KGDGSDDDLEQEKPIQSRDGAGASAHEGGQVIIGMMGAPGRAGGVADDGGDKAGNNGLVAQASDGQDFDRKNRAGQRRSENAAETRGHAGHEEDAAVA